MLADHSFESNPFDRRRPHAAIYVIFRSRFPLAVTHAVGFSLPLKFGVVGHEDSTVLVCLNGLRLLAFRTKEKSESALKAKALDPGLI
jgi:hypothetical protein